MKRFFIFSLILLGASLAIPVQGQENPTGEEIAAMIMNAGRAAGGIAGKGTMDVIDLKANKTDSRNFTIQLSVENDVILSIFRFTDPKLNLATFLTIDAKGKEPELYMYFKTYKQPLRIRARQKEQNFLDTDISTEDLGNMKIEDYTYKRLNDVSYTVDGKKRNCYLLERYPKAKSAYSRHVVVVDKEWLVPVVYKSYNEAGRIVKQFTAADIRKINDKAYMPFNLKIINLEKKHETNVKFTSITQKKVTISLSMMSKNWTE
ncbi:MAG: outer membrane lipoprotein-sorting protein [Spirochaetes bacterium]|nr:outer membrane lipoprotein-sorting protein [Spirochaetota bacterium]